ncbi:MAG TPA: hypothetical protein VMI33_00740 [Streptosporangiaceae bacterium]|nr:hypothetical protein [Streptosporangiaceae bacterium]
MTDTTPAPTYWALLEEITEYRGRLIHMANTIYALIDAEERERAGHGLAAGDPRGPAPDTGSAAGEEAAGWLAPVIPLRPRR